MLNNQRYNIFVLALIALCALLTDPGVSAQKKSDQDAGQQEAQKPDQKPNTKSAQQGEDEPVAITERLKFEKTSEGRPVPKSDEFGNFRPPIINHKGDVAFISWFSSTTPQQGFGQSVFVRNVDGK